MGTRSTVQYKKYTGCHPSSPPRSPTTSITPPHKLQVQTERRFQRLAAELERRGFIVQSAIPRLIKDLDDAYQETNCIKPDTKTVQRLVARGAAEGKWSLTTLQMATASGRTKDIVALYAPSFEMTPENAQMVRLLGVRELYGCL